MNKLVRVSFIVLASLVILRMVGCINVEYATAVLTENTELEIRSEYYKPDRTNGQQLYLDNTSDENTSETKYSFYEYGFHTSPKIGLFIDLNELLKTTLEKNEATHVKVDQLQCGGTFSMPLGKSGSCQYSLQIEGRSKDNNKSYSGVLSGRITFTITGLCSSAKAKDVVKEQIAKLIFSDIEKQLKKM